MRHRHPMLLLVVLLSTAAPAAAQTDDLAKGHYMAGQAYYNQARYAEAVREFQEAYRLSPKAALLYNIAQAYERLGKIEDAIAHLKKYLAAGPDAADRAAVEERLKNLQVRLEQTKIAIACEVSGATVLVDGKELGKTPLSGPLLVPPGSHAVKVSREGYEPFSAFVSVNAGQTVQVAVKLEPVKALQPQPVSASSAPPRRSYLWTWVVGGTAAALLITGAVTGGLALSKAGEAKRRDDSDANAAKSLALVSDITIGVGAAAAVGATILFIYQRRSRSAETPSPAAAVLPLVGPTSAGLSARFDF